MWAVAAGLLSSLAAARAGENEPAGTPGATLAELLQWVDRNNPELASMRFDAEAADARIVPAGALPDPMFQIELQDIPNENFTLSPSRVGSTKYTFAQTLPWWGKRDLKRQAMAAEAGAAAGRVRQTRVELHARVKSAFARYYYAHEAARQTRDILDLMKDLERIALSRYSGGLVPQQDVLKAQLEQTALQGELVQLGGEARQSRARLNGALARPAEAALAEPSSLTDAPRAPLDLAQLEARAVESNPLVAVQAAQIQGAERNRELAAKNWYPDFTVGVAPIQRDKRLDAWEVMVAINVPLQIESRREQEREAQAMAAAARAKRDATASGLRGELGEAAAGFNAALEQEQLLDGTLVPQAELTLRAALAGYETGRVDFATLLDAQRQVRRGRLDLLRVRVDQRMRLAEVERILGEE